MSIEITLADIALAAEKRYGDVVIPLPDGSKATLRNALRLSKDERAALTELEERSQESDESVDEFDMLAEIVVALAATPAQGKKLVAACDGDLTLLATIIHKYREHSQAGEAAPSQS